MNKNQENWVVVEVRSGIPVSVKLFSDQESAKTFEKKLRSQLNLESDETGLFSVDVTINGVEVHL